MKTATIFFTVFLLLIAITMMTTSFGAEYIALGVLFVICLMVIGVVFIIIQQKSGVSFAETGRRAHDRLQNAYDGNMSDEDLQVRMHVLHYDESDLINFYNEDEEWEIEDWD
jgi:hypothetical protein